MSRLLVWGLSDRKVEEMANENLSVMCFLGLQIEDEVPDHSSLSRFRTLMVKAGAFDPLLEHINEQLATHQVVVKEGIQVDASMTDASRKPTTYQMAEDREESTVPPSEIEKQSASIKCVKIRQPGVDTEARWVRKAGQLRDGHKKPIATDHSGLVLAVETTSANVHDTKPFDALLDKVQAPPDSRILADKACESAKRAE